MVKTLKNLLLQNHWASSLETWYVASCIAYHHFGTVTLHPQKISKFISKTNITLQSQCSVLLFTILFRILFNYLQNQEYTVIMLTTFFCLSGRERTHVLPLALSSVSHSNSMLATPVERSNPIEYL